MYGLGRHVLAEVYGCDFKVLDDLKKVEEALVGAALKAGAEICGKFFHKFSPQGVSGVVVISESHLAIHTWPEFGYAAVDIFTCGQKVDPWVACNFLKDALAASDTFATEVSRGVPDKKVANL